MNKVSRVISSGAVIFVVGILLVSLPAGLKAQGEAWSPVDIPGPDEHPAELIQLTEEFRTILGWGSGAPDYAGTVGRQKEKLPEFRARLEALDTSDWSVHEKIDYLPPHSRTLNAPCDKGGRTPGRAQRREQKSDRLREYGLTE